MVCYNGLKKYLKEKYGGQVQKLCINGGFTCPNRDGAKGRGGCIFCSGSGSGDQIPNPLLSIESQIEKAVAQDKKYIAYFQNFSNTYASVETLQDRFSPALKHDQIVEISIATRPDCINKDVVQLLSRMNKIKKINVELGLQTANDKTAKLINRCYETKEFSSAVKLLNCAGIDVIVHIIIGLPNENRADIEKTVAFLNTHNYNGIKIHALYVLKDTPLAAMLNSGEYSPISREEYVESAVFILTHIPPHIVVHRLTGDADKKTLLAPEWTKNKISVINAINKTLFDLNLRQGSLY